MWCSSWTGRRPTTYSSVRWVLKGTAKVLQGTAVPWNRAHRAAQHRVGHRAAAGAVLLTAGCLAAGSSPHACKLQVARLDPAETRAGGPATYSPVEPGPTAPQRHVVCTALLPTAACRHPLPPLLQLAALCTSVEAACSQPEWEALSSALLTVAAHFTGHSSSREELAATCRRARWARCACHFSQRLQTLR